MRIASLIGIVLIIIGCGQLLMGFYSLFSGYRMDFDSFKSLVFTFRPYAFIVLGIILCKTNFSLATLHGVLRRLGIKRYSFPDLHNVSIRSINYSSSTISTTDDIHNVYNKRPVNNSIRRKGWDIVVHNNNRETANVILEFALIDSKGVTQGKPTLYFNNIYSNEKVMKKLSPAGNTSKNEGEQVILKRMNVQVGGTSDSLQLDYFIGTTGNDYIRYIIILIVIVLIFYFVFTRLI